VQNHCPGGDEPPGRFSVLLPRWERAIIGAIAPLEA
jgi:hypothetical protein